ncbi:MAG TPA: guanylate kinase [Gemmatimonadales bacterium]|nr:guanylate kinase [Gemmatimonadales bacterium]HEU5357659.1 guanylate kinase [Gemmatimonadales bacterium]
MKPFLLVLSSPSGGGKTTIARALLDGREDMGYSVSATTRPMRDGEADGRDYHFLSREEFERRVKAGAFLEWAEYGGNLYGTLRSEIDAILARGSVAVLDIEIRGAAQIRARVPDAVHVFVLPPSAAVLGERLRARRTESSARIRQRLERAADEVMAVPDYDYVVENANLVTAVDQVAAIVEAELHRVSRQERLGERIARLHGEILGEARREQA